MLKVESYSGLIQQQSFFKCSMTTRDSSEEAIKARVCLGRKLAVVGLMMCYCYRPVSGPVINTVKGVLINLATLTIIFTPEGEELLSVY